MGLAHGYKSVPETGSFIVAILINLDVFLVRPHQREMMVREKSVNNNKNNNDFINGH